MELKNINLPLEIVILLIGGMALVITGFLLYAASSGAMPFYENGFYGLLLVIFALQTIMIGKTPFGDTLRSRTLLAAGVIVAAVGIDACFIPTFNQLPRALLLICLGPGSLALFLQMCLSGDKLRTWMNYGGIFHHLIIACSAVYSQSMLLAFLIWKGNLIASSMIAAVVFIYGITVFFLAFVLLMFYRIYPAAEKDQVDQGLSADQTMILLTGVFMIILGVMMIPVNMGLLPFSGSAQIGLLVVIFAVQMLSTGSTPLRVFPRSLLIIYFGLLFAALGIISCIVPGILISPLTILVGVLNIAGGVITLLKIFIPRLKMPDQLRPSAHPVTTRLFAAQVILSILQIMFGTSMLIPNLVPGFIIGIILAANGCVLLYLLYILVVIDKMQVNRAGAA